MNRISENLKNITSVNFTVLELLAMYFVNLLRVFLKKNYDLFFVIIYLLTGDGSAQRLVEN